MMHPPIGSIGFCEQEGFIGALIAWREGFKLLNGRGCSHVVMYVGEGHIPESSYDGPLVWDATVPRSRLTPLEYWRHRYIEWYAPASAFSREQERVLRSIAFFTHDRIPYSFLDLAKFIVLRYPDKRDPNLFCSEGVAEMYMTARDEDVSRIGEPWQVDPRALYVRVQQPDFRHVAV